MRGQEEQVAVADEVELLEARRPGKVATGEFGAMMDVSLTNDGPVTLVIDR